MALKPFFPGSPDTCACWDVTCVPAAPRILHSFIQRTGACLINTPPKGRLILTNKVFYWYFAEYIRPFRTSDGVKEVADYFDSNWMVDCCGGGHLGQTTANKTNGSLMSALVARCKQPDVSMPAACGLLKKSSGSSPFGGTTSYAQPRGQRSQSFARPLLCKAPWLPPPAGSASLWLLPSRVRSNPLWHPLPLPCSHHTCNGSMVVQLLCH